jgi:hypothetical protein
MAGKILQPYLLWGKGAGRATRRADVHKRGAYGEAIGQLEGEPLYHASLDPTEYKQLLDSQGFDVVATVPEDQCCGGRTVWLAQLR